MERMLISPQCFRLMLRVALMLSEQARYDASDQVLRALIAYRPDIPHPRLCLVMNDLSRGNLASARTELESTISDFPNSQLGRGLLGFVYCQMGISGGDELLASVIEDGRDIWAIEFASDVLHSRSNRAPPTQPQGAISELIAI